MIRILENDVRFGCPLEPYTTFRVGGKAEALCTVKAVPQLKALVSFAAQEDLPYLVVGRGSNLLVKDKGLRGLAFVLKGDLEGVEEQEGAIHAGGGAALSELVRFSQKKGLAGLEFLAGIPGTVGGAVAMNAGAWGKSTGDAVTAVEILKADGQRVIVSRSEIEFSYRKATLPMGAVVVKVQFKATPDRPEAIGKRVREVLERRKAGQPLDYPSAGSVFKNPPGDYAGRLIESVGLKGKRVGGAMISDKHANVIVNVGGAKAEDILSLMNMARQRVREQTGIDLEPEIKVVGE